MAPLIETRNLTKTFGAIAACSAISMSVEAGEIHALMGENGAGKSTLVKMLFGSLAPDSGSILWRGDKTVIESPADAKALGIGMVFQHFSLFDGLNVAENIALSLGRDQPMDTIAAETSRVSKLYGLPLDPAALVADLSVGERQRIEIIRCLLQEPDLIILDEPTSVLTPQEADRLFETLLRLKDEGKSILYISHRLDEVQRICDRATVLRHGKVVARCTPRDETPASLARMMVGSHVNEVARSTRADGNSGEGGLRLKNLDRPSSRPFSVALKDVSLDVRPGVIVGIAGVAGNGQGELFEAISGEWVAHDAQSIEINGNPVADLAINERRALGAAFIPEERLGHGAAPEFPLTANTLLSRHQTDRAVFLGRLKTVMAGALKSATDRVNQVMDVRKSADNPNASALSGGNLQKFIVGRELDRQPTVLIINQPTWGVDAGAAARIRQRLVDLAEAGSAILVISQDLDELLEFTDFIAVMHDGTLSRPLPTSSVTREEIGLLMGGRTESTETGVAA